MTEDNTPSKSESNGTVNMPSNNAPEEEALTPLHNLKMLIRVASETEAQPSRRELFKDELQINHDEQMNSSDKLLTGVPTESHDITELQPQRLVKSKTNKMYIKVQSCVYLS